MKTFWSPLCIQNNSVLYGLRQDLPLLLGLASGDAHRGSGIGDWLEVLVFMESLSA